MKRLLVLLPIFAVAACGNLEFVVGTSANANVGGSGNSGVGSGGAAELCSCGNEFVNGSRLTAKTSHTESGTRFIRNNEFHDSELNIDCSFVETPFDGYRCLPKHEISGYFVDTECTIPMYVEKDPCKEIPEWIRVDFANKPPFDACGPTYHASTMYKVGEEQFGPNKYYIMYDWGCGNGGTIDNAMGQRAFVANKGPSMINFDLASNN